MLNRRGFLSSLFAAAVLDPERLLWVPGKKLISIPCPARIDGQVVLRDLMWMYLENFKIATHIENGWFEVTEDAPLKCNLPLPSLSDGRTLFNPEKPIPWPRSWPKPPALKEGL